MEKISKVFILLGFFVSITIAGYFLIRNETGQESTTPSKREVAVESKYKIIAFGDSLTAGYGLPSAESYPNQLEVALFRDGYDVQVINSGVSGETTRGNLERASFIRSQNPDIVLLGIGGNDALRALSLSDTIKNIVETIDILQSGESPPVVILLGMQAPLNSGSVYKRDFDAMYKNISASKKVELVPFITPEVFLRPEYKLPDGIHLNRNGYKKIIELYILNSVKDALEAITV